MPWEIIDSKTKVDNWGEAYQIDDVICAFCTSQYEFSHPLHYEESCDCETLQRQNDAK